MSKNASTTGNSKSDDSKLDTDSDSELVANDQITGDLSVRVMHHRDLEAALQLSTVAGWNQTADDWQRFLQQSPTGCFVATQGTNIAGTVATISYGTVAWIGMMLVDPAFQRRGIGQTLMERAQEHLNDTPSIKLDATPAGQPLYEKMGFVVEDELTRWTCECLPRRMQLTENELEHVRPVEPSSIPAVVEFDQQVFGAPRPEILRALHAAAPKSAWRYADADTLCAFSLGRPGIRFHQIGPVAATDLAAAKHVTEAALQPLQGRAVVMDVPTRQAEYAAWLQEQGFTRQRCLRRMVKGSAPQPFSPQQFAIAGPELG